MLRSFSRACFIQKIGDLRASADLQNNGIRFLVDKTFVTKIVVMFVAYYFISMLFYIGL